MLAADVLVVFPVFLCLLKIGQCDDTSYGAAGLPNFNENTDAKRTSTKLNNLTKCHLYKTLQNLFVQKPSPQTPLMRNLFIIPREGKFSHKDFFCPNIFFFYMVRHVYSSSGPYPTAVPSKSFIFRSKMAKISRGSSDSTVTRLRVRRPGFDSRH